MSSTTSRRRPAALVAGLVGTAGLVLATSGTLSAFTASITNSVNTAGSGTLTMQETNADGSVVCDSNATTALTDANNTNATCSTINKFGGNLNMASSTTAGTVNTTSVSTTIHIKNTGSLVANSFSLTPGACTQTTNPSGTSQATGTATDFCKHLNVKIVSGSTVIFDGTADALSTGGLIDLAAKVGTVNPGADVPFTFTTSVDPAVGNSYQGLQVSEPLTWTFNA